MLTLCFTVMRKERKIIRLEENHEKYHTANIRNRPLLNVGNSEHDIILIRVQ